MEPIQRAIKTLIEKMGFSDSRVDLDAEGYRLGVFINEGDWLKEWLPKMINDLTQISRLIAKKADVLNAVYVDVNNYRKEREKIIVELAKAAARKVLMTKAEVKLPAMNAYERRLVHTELAARPDVKTESVGEKAERCVVVKLLL